MADPSPYPDVERLLVTWLATRTEVRTLTELDVDADEVVQLPELPCHHVEEAPGGAETSPGIFRVVVDLDTYAVGRAAARQLAEDARVELQNARGRLFDVPTGRLTVLDTSADRPVRLPYDGSEIRRFGGQCRLTVQLR